jgi:hypothetical protein
MYKFIKATFLCTILGLSHIASAGLIILDTKIMQGGIQNEDIKASWEANTNNLTSKVIDTFDLVNVAGVKISGKNNIGRVNTISHVNINFDMQGTGFWTLDFGLDSTYGAEVYVDNNLVIDRSDDLWWSRDWNNRDVFSLSNFEFTQGEHDIDLYFAENCCDGYSSIQLTNNLTQEVALLSTSSLQAASVPEPETFMLFGLGLIGLAMRRKVG